jgi:glycosyltransferase involved in cell wall biosynthesis
VGLAARATLHYLRAWDVAASQRVDCFIANSRFVAQRIEKTYRRKADVIYPPVEVDDFSPSEPREDYYCAVSRFVTYKRMDLIVQTLTKLGRPAVIIGTGPDWARAKRQAGPNVKMLGWQPTDVVRHHLERCKALLFAAEEDFGIVPVEAQAAGAPVIALGRGGALETVVDGETGLYFEEQTEQSLGDAIQRFESRAHPFSPARIRKHAEKFSRARFQQELRTLVDRERRARACRGSPSPSTR